MDHKAKAKANAASSLPVQTDDTLNEVNGTETGTLSAVADPSPSPFTTLPPPPTISPTFTHPTDPTYPLYTPTPTPPRTHFSFDSMPAALAAFARGEFVVVMDDEGRENEGDLIIAARFVTREKMAWMVRRTRCVCVCVSLSI